MGWRRCGEEFAFLIRLKQERYRASEKRKRAKAGVTTRGRGLVGIGNGDTPPGKHNRIHNRQTGGRTREGMCCSPTERPPVLRGS